MINKTVPEVSLYSRCTYIRSLTGEMLSCDMFTDDVMSCDMCTDDVQAHVMACDMLASGVIQ